MTKNQFLEYCFNTYGTSPDYPFEDLFETAVLRHGDTRKWYAIVMRVPRCKFGQGSDEVIDVANRDVWLLRCRRGRLSRLSHEQATLDFCAFAGCAR